MNSKVFYLLIFLPKLVTSCVDNKGHLFFMLELGLPDLTNENIGHPVEFEFQRNNEYFFSV